MARFLKLAFRGKSKFLFYEKVPKSTLLCQKGKVKMKSGKKTVWVSKNQRKFELMLMAVLFVVLC